MSSIFPNHRQPAEKQLGQSFKMEATLTTCNDPAVKRCSLSTRHFFFDAAATIAILFSIQFAIDHSSCAPNSSCNGDCPCLTIPSAGAAFHACIEIYDHCAAIAHFEHVVRTDNCAHSAAIAFLRIELQRNHVFQIF